MKSKFNQKPISPSLGLTVGILAASIAAILIRFAQKDAPSLVIAAYRLTFASIILVPLVLIRDRDELKKMNRKQLTLAAAAGFFLAIHFATWITSLEYTSVASSVVLVATSPLFVAILSPVLLSESVHQKLRQGLLLSLIGAIIVGLSDACYFDNGLQCPTLQSFFTTQSIKGDLLALGGAITGAAYILIGRQLRGKVALLPYISIAYGSAAIVLIGFVLITRSEPFTYRPDTYLWFFLLALFPQLIGHSTINWALRFLPAAFVSVTLLGEPIASTIWAYLFFREFPSGLMIVGAILILIGIAIASQHQPSKNVEPDPGGSSS